MHSLMNLTVFIVNLSTLCSYLCILHLKWCVYQFIIIIIIKIIRDHNMLSRFLLKNPAFLRLMSLFMMLGGWDV